jgi:hypothetical protein
MIRGLAEYEKLAHLVTATEERVRATLFGAGQFGQGPAAEVLLGPAEKGWAPGRVARIAVERGLSRVEWEVLDWNEPSIRFYRRLGAIPMDAWTKYRLTGEAFRKLAEQ